MLSSSLLLGAGVAGCGLLQKKQAPLPTVRDVDLQRYVGRWYVIANIPPWIERGAHNSVEEYRLDEDGNVPTVFTWRKRSFDGPLRRLRSKGFPSASNPGLWGVQFIWPIKAEYRIAWLAPDYSRVIVARSKRDYVWLMARTPTLPTEEFEQHRKRIADLGYDVSRLQRVPQHWPDPGR
ncbi:MAG: lipocalin family protein [Burkholderiales bacterium]